MKYQRDVSPIEDKVLAMYARGLSQRDIAATIEDIYGFEMSHEQISHITDCVMEEVDRWRTRPLKPFYPFAFVDCIYVSLRTERGVQTVPSGACVRSKMPPPSVSLGEEVHVMLELCAA